ncbi:MAG: hypothetical protein Q7J38_03010 [Gallionella sp.]|nr:hypothetical protein [Gallionella sp.]
MNLLEWDLYVVLKELSNRFISYLRAISIPPLCRSRDIDYSGLNAALRRYEQDSTLDKPEKTKTRQINISVP